MASASSTGDTNSLPGLIAGILDDAQELISQQFSLFRTEVQSDLVKTRDATTYVMWGAVMLVPGAILFCLMLVHLLHWWTAPPGQDLSSIPLWGCYAIVSGLFLVPGGILLLLGVQKFQSFNPLPDETADALVENVQWLTKNKK